MIIMSSIICTILICLIVWVQIARGDGSRYGIGTLNDDFAPDEVKSIIKNVKLEKQLDGYKLLSILKKKYGFENYSIITMKDHSINQPKAHTKFDYKFSANTYFQENMTIRIYQDCIHEIQHAKDRMLIIKYYLFLCISFLITISAFILSKSLLLSIAVCFWIDVIRRAIIIERNAIQFAADECFSVTQDLGFSEKECEEISSYLKDKAKNIHVWYKWWNIQKTAIFILCLFFLRMFFPVILLTLKVFL